LLAFHGQDVEADRDAGAAGKSKSNNKDYSNRRNT
jgi:hypothetical protein